MRDLIKHILREQEEETKWKVYYTQIDDRTNKRDKHPFFTPIIVTAKTEAEAIKKGRQEVKTMWLNSVYKRKVEYAIQIKPKNEL